MIPRTPRSLTLCALLPALLGGAGSESQTATVLGGGELRKIAAGLHDGDAFGPRVRPDGKWVAYGVREEVKGTFKTSYYARSLVEDGVFRTVWPNQHPSFHEGEGTASFTDLVGFEWARDGKFDHNAMVALHKTLAEELLIETMNVRLGGEGGQTQPQISPDGTRLVAVSAAGSQTDLWVIDLRDGAEPLQITFTEQENETLPAWHAKGEKVIFERRNRLGSDVWEFDFATFQANALVKEGTSDEIKPSYSPDGKFIGYLSNGGTRDKLRWDLMIAAPGSSLPVAAIENVRVSEKTRGYTWGPFGKFVIAVQDDAANGYPLVIAPIDGSRPPIRMSNTIDNMDPEMVGFGGAVRLVWAATDTDRPEGKRYRIVYVSDYDYTELRKAFGIE